MESRPCHIDDASGPTYYILAALETRPCDPRCLVTVVVSSSSIWVKDQVRVRVRVRARVRIRVRLRVRVRVSFRIRVRVY